MGAVGTEAVTLKIIIKGFESGGDLLKILMLPVTLGALCSLSLFSAS